MPKQATHRQQANHPAQEAAAPYPQRHTAAAAQRKQDQQQHTLQQQQHPSADPGDLPELGADADGEEGGDDDVDAGAPSTSGRVNSERHVGWRDLGRGSLVGYWPGACQHLSAMFFSQLLEDTAWEERTVRIMGKSVPQPRLVSYHADDPSLSYTYSGLTVVPRPFSEELLTIKQLAEAVAGVTFNTVLLNYYRNGYDSVSWHADDEKLYGTNPVIASVSFGAARDFLLRPKDAPTLEHTLRYTLEDGDLLVMKGTTQEHWLHCVPKRLRVDKPRINLTFRQVVVRQKSCLPLVARLPQAAAAAAAGGAAAAAGGAAAAAGGAAAAAITAAAAGRGGGRGRSRGPKGGSAQQGGNNSAGASDGSPKERQRWAGGSGG